MTDFGDLVQTASHIGESFDQEREEYLLVEEHHPHHQTNNIDLDEFASTRKCNDFGDLTTQEDL